MVAEDRRRMAAAAADVEVVGVVGGRESVRNRTPESMGSQTPARKTAC